ncbi:MAG: hypothetical protein ACO2O0_13560 [Desulfurococcales archaeon]
MDFDYRGIEDLDGRVDFALRCSNNNGICYDSSSSIDGAGNYSYAF